jgi:hypothetical protein
MMNSVKIRLDQPVSTTDGPFGEIGDVVIDPIRRTITHIVVEPHHRHYQARLVPIDLVDATETGVALRLGEQQLRALQTVAETDFLPMTEAIDLGDDWDVGIEHIVALPYSTPGGVFGELPQSPDDISDSVSVNFDRVPKGECEIRRESVVISADEHTVGIVDGFIADETHIEGVIVRTGWLGMRHLVVIPIGSVTRVANDRITIGLTSRLFHRLGPIADLDAVRSAPSVLERVEHAAARIVKRARTRLRTVVGRADAEPGSRA